MPGIQTQTPPRNCRRSVARLDDAPGAGLPRAAAVDAVDFREALGRFASGVTIITTRHGEVDHGATVSAFCSVSLAPPLVLCCFQRESATARAIFDRGRFAVSLLSADQAELARRFAAPRADRFDGVAITRTDDGLPLIDAAVGQLVCGIASHASVGDHVVVFGRVERIETTESAPLVVFRGAFGAFGLKSPGGE